MRSDKPKRAIFCTSSALELLQFDGGPFSCWLQFEQLQLRGFEETIRHLVHAGCVHFHVSGVAPEQHHDQIDEILIEMQAEDPVTVWATESLDEIAWEFWNVEYSSSHPKTKLVAVIGGELSNEVARLGDVARAISKAMQPGKQSA